MNINIDEISKIARDCFNDILNHEPTEREKEIKEKIRQEKEEYEKRRADFYNNPLHWSNNKRRMHGLSVLRGVVNKRREKHYPPFQSTTYLSSIFEDIIDATIGSKYYDNIFIDEFVEFKNKDLGEKHDYWNQFNNRRDPKLL